MTVFYLIRHAQKEADDDILAARTPGIPLTSQGRAQAQAVAHRLKATRLDRILSSPMQRAVETARLIAAEQGLDIETAEALTEFDFGQWAGRRQSELGPDPRWRAFNTLRSATSTPAGETMLNVQARFVAEMLRVREAFPNAHIALVSHGDPIRAALAHFLGVPLDQSHRIEVSLASTSVVALSEFEVRVLRINETP